MHIIFFDPDDSFSSSLQEIQEHTFEKIETLSYPLSCEKADALFINSTNDPQIIEGFVRAFLQDAKSMPLAIWYPQPLTFSIYQKLKNELKISYVLEKPAKTDELLGVISALQSATSSEKETPFLPPELLQQYDQSIDEKLSKIDQLVRSLDRKAPQVNILSELKKTAHKIAGSAGSYGYDSVSNLCKKQELFLYDFEKKDSFTEEEKIRVIDACYCFLRELRLNFQHITSQKVLEKKNSSANERFFIIVSPNTQTIKDFQDALYSKSFKLVHYLQPEVFLNECTHLENIETILIEDQYPTAQISSKDLLNRIHELQQKPPPKIGILTSEDSVEKRVLFLEENIDFVLKRPISPKEMDTFINSLLGEKQFSSFKALVLDDDQEFIAVLQSYLNELGVEVHTITDERKLIESLEKLQPQILFLDLFLPRFNGKVLFKAIRADMRFRDLQIVIVTAHQDEELVAWAFKHQCHALFFKPLNKKNFLEKTRQLLDQYAQESPQNEVDPTTSLSNEKGFLKKIENRFSENSERPFSLVFFVISQFGQLNTILSSEEIADLKRQVTKYVSKQFPLTSFFGVLSPFGLLVFSNEQNLHTINEKAQLTIQLAPKNLWLKGREDLFFTLKALVWHADYQKNWKQEYEALKNEARAMSSDQSASFRVKDSSKNIEKEQPHVFLVDNDKDLAEILSYFFQKEGIHFTHFESYETAANHFQSIHTPPKRWLILIERLLPDKDGIYLMDLLKEKFQNRFKAFFISSLSSEKDILLGLEAGALDYIVKPISLKVLFFKCHRELESS